MKGPEGDSLAAFQVLLEERPGDLHEIVLGEDPHKAAFIVDYRQAADALLAHETRRFEGGRIGGTRRQRHDQQRRGLFCAHHLR